MKTTAVETIFASAELIVESVSSVSVVVSSVVVVSSIVTVTSPPTDSSMVTLVVNCAVVVLKLTV